MVFYFTSNSWSEPVTIYMGKDKFENEDLIKHGWEEDIWFHVDKLSSAHVYLRCPTGIDFDNIPADLLNEVGQLTRANSIEGSKKDHLIVIYTPWDNLLKTGDMDTGQVSFKNNKRVKRFKVQKDTEIIKRINKTKREEYPDLFEEKVVHQKAIRKQESPKIRKPEKLKQKKPQEAYEELFDEQYMYSNKGLDLSKSANEIEEDFM